jgi:WXXGXW repeat (2 copies)
MRIHSSARILVMTVLVLAMSAASFGQIGIGISVNFGPPAIPVYVQPPCPSEGYIWTPGYWAWDASYGDYYWVPGTWILAPQPGFLWTPGWWGWGGSAFIFHAGYWGPHVGFYGGINYGFGYFGNGFEGGRWDGNRFFYNRSVTNVNVTNVTNVYNTTVINNNNNRVSYNGGNGGINARPSPEQEQYEHERHLPPVSAQMQHAQEAAKMPELRASANHGKPPIAATAKPAEFRGEGAVPAREAGGEYKGNPGGEHGAPQPTHAKDLPAHEKLPAANTGDEKLNAKYQQQQDKLAQKQEQEHQKLAQKQEQDHQKAAKQQANEQRQQQMEQKHQQQTQQMEQRHTQQQQHMQQHQQPASHPAPQKK